MNVEALLRLARALEDPARVPRSRFSAGSWGHEGPCGTVGCAVYWALALGIAPPGMVLQKTPSGWIPAFPGTRDTGFYAVERAYGLTAGQTVQVFSPHMYVNQKSPYAIAKRIRELVRKEPRDATV